MSKPQLLFVDYQMFTRLGCELAERVRQSGETFDEIISISRGGALVARILSDLLDLPILNIGIRSYHSVDQQGELVVTQPLTVDIEGKKILVVDEICDSGKTFEVAVAHLKGLQPSLLKTVSLYLKPHATFMPDFVGERTDKWVVFPYEIRETIEGLKTFMEVDPVLVTEVKTYFGKVGVSQNYIEEL